MIGSCEGLAGAFWLEKVKKLKAHKILCNVGGSKSFLYNSNKTISLKIRNSKRFTRFI